METTEWSDVLYGDDAINKVLPGEYEGKDGFIQLEDGRVIPAYIFKDQETSGCPWYMDFIVNDENIVDGLEVCSKTGRVLNSDIIAKFKIGGREEDTEKLPKKWAPWNTRYEVPLATNNGQPITEPPCKYCKHFNPITQFHGDRFDGVVICHSEDMHHDFSCYRDKEE